MYRVAAEGTSLSVLARRILLHAARLSGSRVEWGAEALPVPPGVDGALMAALETQAIRYAAAQESYRTDEEALASAEICRLEAAITEQTLAGVVSRPGVGGRGEGNVREVSLIEEVVYCSTEARLTMVRRAAAKMYAEHPVSLPESEGWIDADSIEF